MLLVFRQYMTMPTQAPPHGRTTSRELPPGLHSPSSHLSWWCEALKGVVTLQSPIIFLQTHNPPPPRWRKFIHTPLLFQIFEAQAIYTQLLTQRLVDGDWDASQPRGLLRRITRRPENRLTKTLLNSMQGSNTHKTQLVGVTPHNLVAIGRKAKCNVCLPPTRHTRLHQVGQCAQERCLKPWRMMAGLQRQPLFGYPQGLLPPILSNNIVQS